MVSGSIPLSVHPYTIQSAFPSTIGTSDILVISFHAALCFGRSIAKSEHLKPDKCRIYFKRKNNKMVGTQSVTHFCSVLAVCTNCFASSLVSPPQSVHQLLPPTYRDVWLEWRDSEQQQQEASRTAANKPRDQFISRLLTRLKQQQNQSQAQQPAYQEGQGLSGEEEPEDSWENLAGLDIEEKGGKVEDKSEKSRQKDGAASLKAARELLLKLKESALAQKLQVNALYIVYGVTGVTQFHNV